MTKLSVTLRAIRQLSECDQRLFAADCAERVLPLFEAKCPGDKRPQEAIAAARAFARGEIDGAELRAAHSAAMCAVVAATIAATITATATAAVGVAAVIWNACSASIFAAQSAARITIADMGTECWTAHYLAATAAGHDAERLEAQSAFAACTAERKWQAERLVQYLKGDVK